MKIIVTAFLIFVASLSFAMAQVPLHIEIAILKAEDARSYDKGLEDLIKSQNSAVQIRASLAAGRIGNDSAIPALAGLLDNKDEPSVAVMAAFAIGEIESVKGADSMLRVIADPKSPDALVARGVEAAGKIAAANIRDGVSKQLGDAILTRLDSEFNRASNSSTDVIRLGLTAILRSRPTGADERIRKFLASANPTIVADALNTLARLRTKNANQDARDLLSTHADAIVRANASRVLAGAEDKDAVDILINAATKDSDSRVRIGAIRGLAALRDQKAAEPLLKRGEELFAIYSKAKKPNFIPGEQNEFTEIATALGRILANTDNARADKLFADFGKIDKGHATEVYIARVRIGQKRGDGSTPELTDWRQYSTLAQIAGEFALIEPVSEVGKQMKVEAPNIIRPLAKAFAEADPAVEGRRMMAGPDALQAFAGFKTADSGEIARTALLNKDVHMRAAAAGILGGLTPSNENIDALKASFSAAILSDRVENDAQLAILSAIVKLDKTAAVEPLRLALASSDFVLRIHASNLVKTSDLKSAIPAFSTMPFPVRAWNPKVRTKLGQILNVDTDYRRALGRKNGSVRAVLTTEKGTFTIVFNPEEAPLTVDNFIKLARRKYFDGLEVHRVVPNFVMQDGDPRGDGNGGPGWSIRCEVNMLPYDRGAVGMALSGKDTGGSQWFVTHSPQPHLDGGYTVFGRVNETDMKVVDSIVRGDKILKVAIIEKSQPLRRARR